MSTDRYWPVQKRRHVLKTVMFYGFTLAEELFNLSAEDLDESTDCSGLIMTQRRLTVVQMVPALEAGGVECEALEVSDALVQAGHRSIVISAGGRMVEQLKREGGEHIEWPVNKKSPFTLKWIWPLRKLLREEKVDILHARSRVPAWVAWLAWRGMREGQRPRYVTTAHGIYRINAYSAVMTTGERVISISEAVDQYLKKGYPKLDHSRIKLIPRGVDPVRFPRGLQPSPAWQERWKKEFPQLAGKPILSLVGRLTRYKGHPDFLKILHVLKKDIPQIQGLIVGAEDPNRLGYIQELKQSIQELGLQDNVIFTGNRSDVAEIYASSDVVMQMSSLPPEAFGRSTVEALNIGTPVVGWDCGGTTEILNAIYPDGLIPFGEIEQAAAKVKQILAEGASLKADHPFLKQYMTGSTISLYQEIAA